MSRRYESAIGDHAPSRKGETVMVLSSLLNGQFLYVRPRNHIRRVYHASQAADGIWYGMVHFNHRYIRVRRVSRDVWIPVEDAIRHDPLGPNPSAPTDLD
jgi:hypothetical protein